MKEKINWNDQEYELEWVDDTDIEGLENINQVYGFLFTKDEKLCIVRPSEIQGWRLPGGTPEKEDKDWKATLIRESDEEADIELDKESLKIIGYLKITPLSENCEKPLHYALRVKGDVIKINDQTIDIAEGLINEREFIDPKEFLNYCPWGETGKAQINKVLN